MNLFKMIHFVPKKSMYEQRLILLPPLTTLGWGINPGGKVINTFLSWILYRLHMILIGIKLFNSIKDDQPNSFPLLMLVKDNAVCGRHGIKACSRKFCGGVCPHSSYILVTEYVTMLFIYLQRLRLTMYHEQVILRVTYPLKKNW